MIEITNCTLNFVFDRRAAHGLTFAARKLVCDEIELHLQFAVDGGFGGGR